MLSDNNIYMYKFFYKYFGKQYSLGQCPMSQVLERTSVSPSALHLSSGTLCLVTPSIQCRVLRLVPTPHVTSHGDHSSSHLVTIASINLVQLRQAIIFTNNNNQIKTGYILLFYFSNNEKYIHEQVGRLQFLSSCSMSAGHICASLLKSHVRFRYCEILSLVKCFLQVCWQGLHCVHSVYLQGTLDKMRYRRK